MRTQEIRNRITALVDNDTEQASYEDLVDAYWRETERDFSEMSDEEINKLFDETIVNKLLSGEVHGY